MANPDVLVKLRHEQLQYVREMLREIRDIAKSSRQPLVGYFVEMAYLEASDQLRSMHSSVAHEGDRKVA